LQCSMASASFVRTEYADSTGCAHREPDAANH
jgi:hypothetical protein